MTARSNDGSNRDGAVERRIEPRRIAERGERLVHFLPVLPPPEIEERARVELANVERRAADGPRGVSGPHLHDVAHRVRGIDREQEHALFRRAGTQRQRHRRRTARLSHAGSASS
jgi:hypothetical protein